MDTEEFVLSALKDDSMVWDEKTIRQVAFALIDTPNPDRLIERVVTRGAYDCVKLYAIFNFLIIDSMERELGESISKIKYCAQKLRQTDRIVGGLVNLKIDEVDRRIKRMLQISRSLADTQNAREMISAVNRIKKDEPDIYTFQTYYSVYVLFLVETTEKNPSEQQARTLAHILNSLFLGMIEMQDRDY